MTKMFVGGLPFAMTDDQLNQLFASFGTVVSASVVMDKFTGRSRGFGFVEMDNDDEAQNAIKELDGSDVDGRKINVSVARPREDRPRRDNFNRDNNRNNGGFQKRYDNRRR